MGAGLRDKEEASTKKQKRLLPHLHANMTQLTAGSPGNNKERAVFLLFSTTRIMPRSHPGRDKPREIGALSLSAVFAVA
jgi:hypothetical protein